MTRLHVYINEEARRAHYLKLDAYETRLRGAYTWREIKPIVIEYLRDFVGWKFRKNASIVILASCLLSQCIKLEKLVIGIDSA